MLRTYTLADDRLQLDATPKIAPETLWIDLLNPSRAEDAEVEAALGISIPTMEEASEIEASSRLYRENGAHYMTALVIHNSDAPMPGSATTTFVLTGNTLVTIRYHDPRPFSMFATLAAKGDIECTSAPLILIGLIEAVVERSADVIERAQDEVERLAQRIFGEARSSAQPERRLDDVLRGVGRQGEVTSRLRESAFSIERLIGYLGPHLREHPDAAALADRILTAQHDVRSLSDQMLFLMERINFLLDATLGVISIEQNNSVRVFSLLAVTLMPPTLVGSIYGMNFKHMPELEWLAGYPMALVLMLLSGVLPFLYFRRKGWF